MITVGIDLASKPKKTGLCRLLREDGQVYVEDWKCNVTDELIRSEDENATKVGIDVPLGWPVTFVNAVRRHLSGRAWPKVGMESLKYRATDLFAKEIQGTFPLSVSTDRLGIPAMRAAALLHVLDAEADRTGSGRIVEVYPAVALKV